MQLAFDRRAMAIVTVVLIAIIIAVICFFKKYPTLEERDMHRCRLYKTIGLFLALGAAAYGVLMVFGRAASEKVIVTAMEGAVIDVQVPPSGISESDPRGEYGLGAIFRGPRDMIADSKEKATKLKAYKSAHPNASKEDLRQAERAIKADQTNAKYAGKKAAFDARKAETDKLDKGGALADFGKGGIKK